MDKYHIMCWHDNLSVESTIMSCFGMAMLCYLKFGCGNMIWPLCCRLLLLPLLISFVASLEYMLSNRFTVYVFIQDKDLDKAVDAFSRAVQIDPENGEAWNNIACLYITFYTCSLFVLGC